MAIEWLKEHLGFGTGRGMTFDPRMPFDPQDSSYKEASLYKMMPGLRQQ